jgi:GTPase SAR1 family protein
MTTTKTPWQRRAIAAGLRQQALVGLTGHGKTTITRQLRGYWQSGIPRHIRSMIIAWEVMTPEQRATGLQRGEVEFDGCADTVGTGG